MKDDDLKAAQETCQPEKTEAFYTLQEAAHELGVRVLDLERAIQNHHLPFTHQFGRRLIAAGDLAAYRTRYNMGKTAPPSQ